MKRLLLLLSFCFFLSSTLFAQKAASKNNEISLTKLEGPYLVSHVDHQSLNGKIKVSFYYNYETYYLVDSYGKIIRFSSLTEVLNYFYKYGWVFDEVYSFPSGSTEALVFRKKELSDVRTSTK